MSDTQALINFELSRTEFTMCLDRIVLLTEQIHELNTRAQECHIFDPHPAIFRLHNIVKEECERAEKLKEVALKHARLFIQLAPQHVLVDVAKRFIAENSQTTTRRA